MSAKIYTSPEEVKVPEIDFSNFSNEKYFAEVARYTKELKAFIKERGYSGKNAGEIIKFQVADGYAEYMVMSMRPVQLIHLPLMDEYQSEFAHLMTAKEVQKRIDLEKMQQDFMDKYSQKGK